MKSSSFKLWPTGYEIATAILVVILAAVSPSKAEIIYHSADITISDGTYNLDLNGDGIVDFSIISGTNIVFSCNGRVYVSVGPSSGNGSILGPLHSRDPIGPDQVFGEGGVLEYFAVSHIEICWWSSGGPPSGCTDGWGHLLKTDQRGQPRPDLRTMVAATSERMNVRVISSQWQRESEANGHTWAMTSFGAIFGHGSVLETTTSSDRPGRRGIEEVVRKFCTAQTRGGL